MCARVCCGGKFSAALSSDYVRRGNGGQFESCLNQGRRFFFSFIDVKGAEKFEVLGHLFHEHDSGQFHVEMSFNKMFRKTVEIGTENMLKRLRERASHISGSHSSLGIKIDSEFGHFK
jgi:hypothetical protein